MTHAGSNSDILLSQETMLSKVLANKGINQNHALTQFQKDGFKRFQIPNFLTFVTNINNYIPLCGSIQCTSIQTPYGQMNQILLCLY